MHFLNQKKKLKITHMHLDNRQGQFSSHANFNSAQQDYIHALEYLSAFACLCRICFWAICKNMIFIIYLHEDPQLEAIFSVPNPKPGYILSVGLPSSALDVNLLFFPQGMFGLGPEQNPVPCSPFMFEIVCLRCDSPITVTAVKWSVKQDFRWYDRT